MTPGHMYHVRCKPESGQPFEYIGIMLKREAKRFWNDDRERIVMLLVAASVDVTSRDVQRVRWPHDRFLEKPDEVMKATEIGVDELPQFFHWPNVYPTMELLLRRENGQDVEYAYLMNRPT